MKSIEQHIAEAKMEQDLHKVYKSHWPQLLKTIPHLATEDFNQLANPFLIKALPAYRKAKRKVLFIGKETNGWEFLCETLKAYGSGNQEIQHDSSIDYLQWMYEDLRHYRKWDYTPFWRGMRKIYQAITESNDDDGFLHSQLIRFDIAGKKPSVHVEKLLQENFNVLPLEIEALNPDIVIFLTGPNYDDRLSTTFINKVPVEFEKIDGFGERQLVRIIHPDLPRHSYRTYHPGHSLRNQKEIFNPIAEKLARMMRENKNQ